MTAKTDELVLEARSVAKATVDAEQRLRLFLATMLPLEVALVLITDRLSRAHRPNYFTEGTLFTAVSAIQIGLIALTALVNGILAYRRSVGPQGRTQAWPWAMVSGLFLILAVDEWFMIHERVEELTERLLAPLSLPIKSSLMDAPFFMLYFVVALLLWAGLRWEFSGRAQINLLVGAVFLMIGVLLDLLGAGILRVVWEDGFKLLGFLFVWAALLGVAFRRLAPGD